jgi:uncharacterized protein (DUF1800 family)
MAKLHPLLEPYVPSPGDPFDFRKASHLLRRAGFGGTPAEIERAIKDGLPATVDRLLDFPDVGADAQMNPGGGTDLPDLSAIEDSPRTFAARQEYFKGRTPEERMELNNKLQQANRETMLAVMNWWMARMVDGPRPLQEKLTLFWHGHFTTSARDERSAWLMWQQNETLRAHAAGNFRTFVRNISRDPAMIDYLNNQQNRKGRPNENYARELMELFTLGRDNGYTEADIKEVARAFTGWHHDGEHFLLRTALHDADPKVVFGQRGPFDGDDVIDLILARPECGDYIAGRLFDFFAYDAPDPAFRRALGDQLREWKYELRPLLHTIFTSKAFYSPAAIGTQIKGPIYLVASTVRALEIDVPGRRRRNGMLQGLEQMGQMPLNPPNVKGWPGGRMWINTSTLFVRYNTAVAHVGRVDPAALRFNDLDAPALVDYWLNRLVQLPVDDDKKAKLVETVGRRPTRDSARKMLELIVSMPEYQLC